MSTFNTGRVELSEYKQTALLEKPEIEFWHHLEDSEIISVLCPDELLVVNEIRRLGVRMFIMPYQLNLHKLKYKKSLAVDAIQLSEEGAEFNELYLFRHLIENVETDAESIWPILRDRNDNMLAELLRMHIKSCHLIQAGLIMSLRPEAILFMDKSDFKEHVLILHSVKDVYKQFIFKSQPVFFISKFLEVYSDSPKDSVHLLNVLRFTLSDLKIPDEVVQTTFTHLTSLSSPACPIPILNVFVASKRKLTIDPVALETIILNGDDHLREKVELLKLNLTAEFVEKLVLKCLEIGKYYGVVRSIFSDQVVLNSLNYVIRLKVVKSAVKTNNFNVIKLIFTTEIMKTLIKIDQFGSFLTFAVDFVNLEAFRYLVEAKLVKNNVPIFSHVDIVTAAFKAVQVKKNDLVLYLIQAHYISPYNQISGSTLVAAAVKANNLEIVDAFGLLDSSKCSDIPRVNDREMQEFLKNRLIVKKSPIITRASPIYSSGTTSSEKCSPASPKSASDLRKRGLDEPETSKSESKRARKSMLTSDIMKDFQDALNARDDELMIENLKVVVRRTFLVSALGIKSILMQLIDLDMKQSICAFIDHLLPESTEEVLAVGLEAHSEQILKRLLDTGIVKLEHLVVDKNIIAALFKARHPDLAFNLIEQYGFDMRFSHSPKHNPHGDIILFTTWSVDVTERLLKMGASPEVRLFYRSLGDFILLKQWAEMKQKTGLAQILTEYST